MKEKDRENVFVDKVLSTLDKSTHDLDPETLSRLRLIRIEALETAKSSAWTSRWLGLGPFFRFPAVAKSAARHRPVRRRAVRPTVVLRAASC